mmetsp:Transcript_96177/g.241085  ORF Transcript_96177/g.241085 Transcript_96177/m.241085 type:complete len:92 (+) Transcript_96177:233-508(+)
MPAALTCTALPKASHAAPPPAHGWPEVTTLVHIANCGHHAKLLNTTFPQRSSPHGHLQAINMLALGTRRPSGHLIAKAVSKMKHLLLPNDY